MMVDVACWGEYDLIGPSAFMAAGALGRVHALLDGFGTPPADRGPALTRRLLALMLLHRASNPVMPVAFHDAGLVAHVTPDEGVMSPPSFCRI